MKTVKLVLIPIVVIFLVGCNLPMKATNSTETSIPNEFISDGSQPPQAAPLALPKGATTILLMGSDERPQEGGFRTDTMVLLVMKADGSASMISFPRDLWVYLPGLGMQRINAAQEFGGFKLVQSTFAYNFGFKPQSYVLTNFNGFQSIIDSLGGVDVKVGAVLADARTGYPNGFKVDPGTVHMDGETALWYVRSRKTSSDIDRLRRSQEVLFGVGQKLFSLPGLLHAPQFFAAFNRAVTTDLSPANLGGLFHLMQALHAGKIERYDINYDSVVPYVTGGGAQVLLPRPQAIRQVLEKALGD
jgi:polyisoprenyl-teichoic acid--peptidoglycan teichoic acid transferase